MIKYLIPIIVLLLHIQLQSQNFSILTCSRGDEVYSTFGHSAIRYQDSSLGVDWVYNYGLFDFLDPNFIPKFCMGRLDYMVGKESFVDFMAQYQYQQREVREQVLGLTPAQRDSLFTFLEWNILDANKYYRYDFLFNNCATKIIDVLEKNCRGTQIRFYHDTPAKSFRQLIHANAATSVPWIDWGMDLGIGSPTDRLATDREYCFLPEFVSKSMSLSSNTSLSTPLVVHELILIPSIERHMSHSFFQSPMMLVFIMGLVLLLDIFYPTRWTRITMGLFYILLGIGGLVLAFEWFATEHSVTKANWNLGWMNPVSLILGVRLIWNRPHRKIRIFILTTTLLALIAGVVGWQGFHPASIGLMVISLAFMLINSLPYFPISRRKK